MTEVHHEGCCHCLLLSPLPGSCPGLCCSSQEWSQSEFIQGILAEGNDQYDWSPSTNNFRLAIFYWEYLFHFYKASYLNEEVNCTELSSLVSLLWFTCALIHNPLIWGGGGYGKRFSHIDTLSLDRLVQPPNDHFSRHGKFLLVKMGKYGNNFCPQCPLVG